MERDRTFFRQPNLKVIFKLKLDRVRILNETECLVCIHHDLCVVHEIHDKFVHLFTLLVCEHGIETFLLDSGCASVLLLRMESDALRNGRTMRTELITIWNVLESTDTAIAHLRRRITHCFLRGFPPSPTFFAGVLWRDKLFLILDNIWVVCIFATEIAIREQLRKTITWPHNHIIAYLRQCCVAWPPFRYAMYIAHTASRSLHEFRAHGPSAHCTRMPRTACLSRPH